jgi:hypothetical protein
MYTIFFLTCMFYFRKYLITILLCSSPVSQCVGRFVIPFRVPFLFSPRMVKPLQGRENGVHAWALLTCGISPSLVGSCLDCMVREVTLPTRIYLANQSQPSPGMGVHCCAKWVAQPWASQVSFCAFFCKMFATSHDNMLLSHSFHMGDPSSVNVFGLPGLGSSYMVTHPSRKWVAQRETVLRFTVCSPKL